VIYTVRLAEDDDLPSLIALRTEAEAWLRAKGIQQWTDDYFDYARDVLADSVRRGAAWVVESDGQVVATVTLNGPDMDFWSPEDVTEPALYLGKMIVARSQAGRDLGGTIMNWASLEAASHGQRWLRIDVRRDNTALHHYYLARGFEHIRTVRPAQRRTESGWLAQRRAGTLTDCPLTLTVSSPSSPGSAPGR